MELLKGGDLAPFMQAGRTCCRLDKVVSIVARAADALGYAHKQGVVHRDIKPANMMYHPETDTLKVTDFGIARLTDSLQDQDRHGARHAVLHVARAARRQEDRRPLRPVLARREPLPDARRPACRSRASRWRSSCSRSPTSRRPTSWPSTRPFPTRWSRSSTGAGKDPDAALPDRRGVRRRAARRCAAVKAGGSVDIEL